MDKNRRSFIRKGACLAAGEKTKLGLEGRDEEIANFIELMRNLQKVGIDTICYNWMPVIGPIRPDHVPTMAEDNNTFPGYSTIGTLFANGYIRGLMEAVSKEKM